MSATESTAPQAQEASAMGVTEVVDLSHELFDGMPNIGRNPVTFGAIYTFAGVREMSGGKFAMQGNLIVMPEHCGTHLDAPAHFVEGGTSTDELELSQLVLPGHLLDLRHKARGEAISPEDLEAAAARTGREIGPGVATIVWTGADAYWGEDGYDTHRPVPADGHGELARRPRHLAVLHRPDRHGRPR